jgi:HAE1 family hydrophobic/amphiphilic exporter-1
VKALAWVLKHKTVTLIVAGFIFLGSIGLFSVIGKEFTPAQDNGLINVNMEIPQGLRIDEAKALARDFEQKVRQKYPEIVLVSTSIGTDEGGSLMSAFQKAASYIVNYSLMLTSADNRSRSIFEIADSIRNDIKGYSQISSSYVDPGGSRNAMSALGGNNMEVKVLGYDINQTNYIAEQIANTLKSEKGFRDVSISRDKDRMELQIFPDREKLAQLGLNTSMLASAVRNRVYGLTATKYREEGTEYDVILKFNDANLTSVTDIENITFKGPMGNMVRVGDVAKIKQVYTTPNIEHENKIRVVKVVSALSGTDLGSATNIINAKLATMNIPNNVIVEIGGAAKDMADKFKDLMLLFVLILILTYIVMASQFESLREPFIIMFSVPFALTGVFIALWITGSTINLISGIAIVILVGIAVKNSIVLVDFINLLVDRGKSVTQSILEGGKSRLRPILMTSFTTLLGMLPMALSTGEGSEIWRPLGISIVGGLFFSMMISLIIVPIIYALFANARIKRERKKLQAAAGEISFED